MIKAVIFDMYETLITHFDSPLYFGSQMAADAGIQKDVFYELWEPTEFDRTIGKMTLEEALEMILKKTGRYSEELLDFIVQKRIAVKEECFGHLHPEILPLLRGLKDQGMLLGLISNCFSEEVYAIRKSVLFPYFDEVFLSYEQGVQKPEKEIFERCLGKLGVKASECLYIGDGGSQELEAAQGVGMRVSQAVWYLKEGTTQPTGRKEGFRQIETPLGVLEVL